MKNNYLFHLITDTVAKLLPCAGTQKESTRAKRRILSLSEFICIKIRSFSGGVDQNATTPDEGIIEASKQWR